MRRICITLSFIAGCSSLDSGGFFRSTGTSGVGGRAATEDGGDSIPIGRDGGAGKTLDDAGVPLSVDAGSGGAGQGGRGSFACWPGDRRGCIGPGPCTGARYCMPDRSGFGECECPGVDGSSHGGAGSSDDAGASAGGSSCELRALCESGHVSGCPGCEQSVYECPSCNVVFCTCYPEERSGFLTSSGQLFECDSSAWCEQAFSAATSSCGCADTASGGSGGTGGASDASPAPSCSDGIKNGSESDVDCGGGCEGCDEGFGCTNGYDCAGSVCVSGKCQPTCTDGKKNRDESDVDCGGTYCASCEPGDACNIGSDCNGSVCLNSRCEEASCDDGVRNNSETDIDCGGDCFPCHYGEACVIGSDCEGGTCVLRTCVPPHCTSRSYDGDESDVDCGGSCHPCEDGSLCRSDSDCDSGKCDCASGPCGCPLDPACDKGVCSSSL